MKKKLLLALIMTLSLIVNAQSNLYVNIGVSSSSGKTFAENAYPSLEFGKVFDDHTFGVCVGQNNLVFKDNNYYSEITYSRLVRLNNFPVLFNAGIGKYMITPSFFVEYGLGTMHSIKNYDFIIKVTNFDGTTYLGISNTFNFIK